MLAVPGSADKSTASIRLDSSCANNRTWAAPLRRSDSVLRCDMTGAAALWNSGHPIRHWTDPLDALQWLELQAQSDPASRWIGFLSYDLGRWFENLPAPAVDDLSLP